VVGIVTDQGTGLPARGYRWEPFQPGHEITMRHGAHSERRWRPIADRLAATLVDAAPWATRPAYAPTVAAWCRVEAQLHLVTAWLDEVGPLDDDGVPRPATTLATTLETRAQALRAELGLSPLALARLTAALSAAPGADDDGLAKLRAEGAAILAARADHLTDEEDR